MYVLYVCMYNTCVITISKILKRMYVGTYTPNCNRKSYTTVLNLYVFIVRGRHIGVRVKGALIGSIYKKSLTVDLSASKESVGKLNNLISVDVSEIQSFCCYSHYMWSTVVELSTATTLLFIVVRVLFIHTFIDTYIHTYTHISTTGYDCISCIPNFLVHNYALKYIQYININTYINVHTYILYIQKKITILVHMIC